MRRFISVPLLALGLATCAVLGASIVPSEAQEPTSATFRCGAWLHETCYFSILKPRDKRTDFTLKSGETLKVDGVVPDFDRYIVTINHPAPDDWTSCGHVRGFWCKLARVSSGVNK